MRIVIGNRRYSSWSLRGWLALKQSGIAFETIVLPMDGVEWAEAKSDPKLLPSGKVPVVWDGMLAVWDSLAIIEWMADRRGRDLFWPADEGRRAFARSMAAEMHAGFASLRAQCPMNTGRAYVDYVLTDEARRDVDRIDMLWQQALAASDGSCLFGSYGAADIMYAPVASRFRTYGIELSAVSATYVAAVMEHPFMHEWYAAADTETWRLPRIEF